MSRTRAGRRRGPPPTAEPDSPRALNDALDARLGAAASQRLAALQMAASWSATEQARAALSARRAARRDRNEAVPTVPAPRAPAEADVTAPLLMEWPSAAPWSWPPGVLQDDLPVKVLVTGPFGAGKTTFVRRVAEGAVVDTETLGPDDGQGPKGSTTVSMDFGKLRLAGPEGSGSAQVALFGTPGQARFEFMWRVLAQGMRVFIVLVDASHQHSRDEAREILVSFRRVAPEVPFVVAVNRWVEGHDLGRLAMDLGLGREDVSQLLRADIRDQGQGTALLQFALQFVTPRPDHRPIEQPVGG